MAEPTDVDNDPSHSGLLQSKLGYLLSWTPPELAGSIGPVDPTVFAEFDAERRGIANKCKEHLQAYTDEEIAIIRDPKIDDPKNVRKGWSSFLDHEILKLRRNRPPWYAGGFGHPEYVADFDYWAKMPRLTVDEVLCLSLGVGPEHFNSKELDDLKQEDASKLWPPLRYLLERRVLLRRQFDPQGYDWQVTPSDYLKWCDRVDFDSHAEFNRLLREYHLGASAETPQVAETSVPDKREIDTIAQLFTAMAIEYYGYDPTAARSPVPKEIGEMLANLGLSVSDDTIRKYLKRGANRISPDWKPNKG